MTILSTITDLSQIAALAHSLPKYDQAAADAAAERQMNLTKPPASLGRLEDMAIFMAGWRGTQRPAINTAQAVVFAGNHGVCAQGVNPFPQEVTHQMVANFNAGGAAINQLCAVSGAELSVVALDLDTPTQDFTKAPAMSAAETLSAMKTGAAAVNPNADVLVLGEMGIGNSTIAAAMACAAFGGDAQTWVGRGTGSDAAGKALKAKVIDQGIAMHAPKGIEILATVGGREQAAICGAVLQARAMNIPVLLDGYICTAATVALFAIDPTLLDHCMIAHKSAEPGHAKLLAAFGKDPILDLGMALGEGSGAALALCVLRGALACHNGMATFAEAGVAGA